VPDNARPTIVHPAAGARMRRSSQTAETPETPTRGHSSQSPPSSAAAAGIQGATSAVPAQWMKHRTERQGAQNVGSSAVHLRGDARSRVTEADSDALEMQMQENCNN